MIKVHDHYFEIIYNHKEAFNQEQFENRYSEVLDRYPYIVGDIGYEQLRLRGFVKDNKKGSDLNKRFSTIKDYIYEFCNFGCPYFVLKRLNEAEVIKLIQPETITDVDSVDTQALNQVDDTTLNHTDEISSPKVDNKLEHSELELRDKIDVPKKERSNDSNTQETEIISDESEESTQKTFKYFQK